MSMFESSIIVPGPSIESESCDKPISLSDSADAETIRVYINSGTKVVSANDKDTYSLKNGLFVRIVPDFTVVIDGDKWHSDYKLSSVSETSVYDSPLKVILPVGTNLKLVKNGTVIHDKKYCISDPSVVLVSGIKIPDVMRLVRNDIHILTKFGEGYNVSFKKDQRVSEASLV